MDLSSLLAVVDSNNDSLLVTIVLVLALVALLVYIVGRFPHH